MEAATSEALGRDRRAGRRRHDEAPEGLAPVPDEELDLPAGQAGRAGAPAQAAESDHAEVLDAGRVTVRHLGLETAVLQPEQLRQLGRRPGDDELRRLAGGDHLGEVVDEGDVVRLLGGLLPVAAAAGGDLGDGQADHEQADLGLRGRAGR